MPEHGYQDSWHQRASVLREGQVTQLGVPAEPNFLKWGEVLVGIMENIVGGREGGFRMDPGTRMLRSLTQEAEAPVSIMVL